MSYCTGCGKLLEAGVNFCTGCGEAVAGPGTPHIPVSLAQSSSPGAVATAPAPIQSAPPNEYSHPAADPDERRTPKVMIIVGMVLVILVGVSVGATLYFRREAQAKNHAANARTDLGTATAAGTSHTASPKGTDSGVFLRSLNLPSYPGATAVAITGDTGEEIVSAFKTRDTPRQVIGFYKVRFPVSESSSGDGLAELRADLPNGEHLRVRARAQTPGTEVNIIHER